MLYDSVVARVSRLLLLLPPPLLLLLLLLPLPLPILMPLLPLLLLYGMWWARSLPEFGTYLTSASLTLLTRPRVFLLSTAGDQNTINQGSCIRVVSRERVEMTRASPFATAEAVRY